MLNFKLNDKKTQAELIYLRRIAYDPQKTSFLSIENYLTR